MCSPPFPRHKRNVVDIINVTIKLIAGGHLVAKHGSNKRWLESRLGCSVEQINFKGIEDECRLLKCAKRSDSVHAMVLEDAIVIRLF